MSSSPDQLEIKVGDYVITQGKEQLAATRPVRSGLLAPIITIFDRLTDLPPDTHLICQVVDPDARKVVLSKLSPPTIPDSWIVRSDRDCLCPKPKSQQKP